MCVFYFFIMTLVWKKNNIARTRKKRETIWHGLTDDVRTTHTIIISGSLKNGLWKKTDTENGAGTIVIERSNTSRYNLCAVCITENTDDILSRYSGANFFPFLLFQWTQHIGRKTVLWRLCVRNIDFSPSSNHLRGLLLPFPFVTNYVCVCGMN